MSTPPHSEMLLLLGVPAGMVSFALTALMRSYAIRHNVVDRPSARSLHAGPMPRGGGVAVVATVALGLSVGAAAEIVAVNDALTLGIGMTVLGATGWADDRRGLQARIRIIVHFGVSLWTLYMFGGLPAVRLGIITLQWGDFGYVAGAVGIVWAINLFNFMDGIDGLAGSQGALIFGTGAVLFAMSGERSLAFVAAAVAAASLGFLAWNWPPAKIFLGDVGSGPLGYLAAGLAIASENRGSVPLIVIAIVATLFIADATVTLFRRLLRGDRLSDAHRQHAYQRLAQAWSSHRRVTIAAAFLTLGFAALGAVGAAMPQLLIPALLLSFGATAGLLVLVERRAPMGSRDVRSPAIS